MIHQIIIRHVPTLMAAEDRWQLVYVCTKGVVDDYAVYCGICPCNTPREDAVDFVQREGQKISVEEAMSLFPFITKEHYRQ